MFIPSTESGVQLELVVARPQSKGPYPTLIFNHGSTGRGKNPSVFSRTVSPAIIKKFFIERGWMVLFPQRRGRGKSGGQYAEGLASDGTGYSCDVQIVMRGFDRAVEDMDAVMAHVKKSEEVDRGRIAIGGVSRGGILSIAYAGLHPNEFCGVISFNGGWMGQGCSTYEAINLPIFRRGASTSISSLWLHGTRDNYYSIAHCHRNFEGFVSAGGKGKFVEFPYGHALIYKQELWQNELDRYIKKIEKIRSV